MTATVFAILAAFCALLAMLGKQRATGGRLRRVLTWNQWTAPLPAGAWRSFYAVAAAGFGLLAWRVRSG
jgi:hypothetical protein